MPVLNTAADCFSGTQTGPPCTAPEAICTDISHRAIRSAHARAFGSSYRCAYSSSEGMM
jgi:hypothetical protein